MISLNPQYNFIEDSSHKSIHHIHSLALWILFSSLKIILKIKSKPRYFYKSILNECFTQEKESSKFCKSITWVHKGWLQTLSFQCSVLSSLPEFCLSLQHVELTLPLRGLERVHSPPWPSPTLLQRSLHHRLATHRDRNQEMDQARFPKNLPMAVQITSRFFHAEIILYWCINELRELS